MPNKPIKRDYKIEALCDRSYLFNFMFYLRFWKTVELTQYELLTSYQNVIYNLAQSLPSLPTGQTYIICLNNLFINTVLFGELKKLEISAYETTRSSSSKDFPETLNLLKSSYTHILP